MTSSTFRLFAAFFCLSCVALYAQNTALANSTVVDKATGESFPSEVSFDQGGKVYQLQATGVATRKKFFVKVYSVAHYLQVGAAKGAGSILSVIMQDNNAKQLTMRFVRNVEGAKIQDGYRESFKNAIAPSEWSQLQSVIDQYIQWFGGDVKKGDEQILRWLPGGYVEVLINGQKVGSLTNPAFAKGLWSLWFGEKSAVDRNNLISLVR